MIRATLTVGLLLSLTRPAWAIPQGCQRILLGCFPAPSALPRNESNYTYRDQTACISTGSIDASGSATVTVNWPVPSQIVALGTGNSYYVDCHAENQQPTPAAGVTAFVGPEVAVLTKSPTGVTVRVANHDGAAARTAEVCCRGYRFAETNE